MEYFRQSYVTRTLFVLLFYSIPLAIIFSQVVFGIRKFSGRKEGNSFNEDSLLRNYVQITFLGEMKFMKGLLEEVCYLIIYIYVVARMLGGCRIWVR